MSARAREREGEKKSTFAREKNPKISLSLFPYLNRLHHERDDIRVALQRSLQGRNVVVRDVLNPGHKGPKAAIRVGVRRRRNGGERPAPEVSLGEEDDCFVFRDALDLVAPTTVIECFFVLFCRVD